MSSCNGSRPDASSSSDALEAVGVVTERAGDHELVEQDAVGVELRPRHARAHQHERAPPLQLGEPGLHGLAVAGALEDDVDRVVDHGARDRTARGPRATSGPTTSVAPSRRASAWRTADGSLTFTSSTPMARSAAMVSAPIGPAPEHERALARLHAGVRDAVQRDRERLGERGFAQRHAVGHAQQLALVDLRVVRERTLPVAAGSGRVAFDAQRRMARCGTSRTSPHRGVGPPITASPTDHRVTRRTDRDDDAAPLVAADRAAPSPTVEDHVQVAAAHAAMTDLDQHVGRADVGHRHLFDDELVLAAQHRRLHLLRKRHAGVLARFADSTRSGRYSGCSVSHSDARCIDCSLFLLMNL